MNSINLDYVFTWTRYHISMATILFTPCSLTTTSLHYSKGRNFTIAHLIRVSFLLWVSDDKREAEYKFALLPLNLLVFSFLIFNKCSHLEAFLTDGEEWAATTLWRSAASLYPECTHTCETLLLRSVIAIYSGTCHECTQLCSTKSWSTRISIA